MRKFHFVAAMTSALVLSTPASAGFFDLTLAPYFGASLGAASSELDCPTGVQCDSADAAWKIFGGLEMNEYISMEVGYIDMGTDNYGGDLSGTRYTNGILLDVLGTYNVNPSLVFLGRGGMNILNAEVDGTIAQTYNDNAGDTDIVWSFGLGAQYNVTPAVGIRLEWERFFSVGDASDASWGGTGEADIDLFSAGIVYKF